MYMLVAQRGDYADSRRWKQFRTREKAEAAMPKWAAQGRATQWLYGPAERCTTEGKEAWTRPLLAFAARVVPEKAA